MELSELKKIGLTDGEIRVYDALLELGETTRTSLAKKSGISPSKIYDVANRLIEKGIISSVKKQGVIHFSAADPERIKGFLQHKEQELRKKLQAEFAARTRANLNKQREELSRKKVVLEQEIQQKISSAFS